MEKGYSGANYVILYHLLSASDEDKTIMEKRLKEADEEQYNEFVEWKESIIEIWRAEGKSIPPWK